MNEITIDTAKLRSYAAVLDTTNTKLKQIDGSIDSLYSKYGLQGLSALGKANTLTKCSKSLAKCRSYLIETANDFEQVEKKLQKLDPCDFKKPIVDTLKDMSFKDYVNASYQFGHAVVKKAIDIRRREYEIVHDAAQSLIDSYVNKGWVYDAVQYGKCVVKAAEGVAKIAVGVASILGTGGLSTPVAILSMFSGVNDIANAFVDASFIHEKQYDEVGKHNVFRDMLRENGAELGARFGNEELGRTLGNITYYGVDVVLALNSISEGFEAIKDLKSVNWGEAWEDLKYIGNTDVGKLLQATNSDIAYQLKLLSYSEGMGNLIESVGAFVNLGDSAVELGEGLDHILVMDENWSNPVLKGIEKVSDVVDYIGKGGKAITTGTELLFG